MQIYRLAFVICGISLLTACADFNSGYPPAPVFGGTPDDNSLYGQYQRRQDAPQQSAQPQQIIETKPLEGYSKAPEIIELRPEIPPPVDNAIEPNAGLESFSGQPNESNDPFGTEQPADNLTTPETEPPAEELKPDEIIKPVAPPLPEVPKAPESLVPLDSFAPQSPAIGSLVMAANANTQSGNLDSAVSSIERAIRIEPRNATLYYKLAVLRLKQSKPKLAEDLARKAAILAVNDNALKKHSWLLIANARALQHNPDGANKAKLEASKY